MQAVEIETEESNLAPLYLSLVVAAQPLNEVQGIEVRPHPGREYGEGSHGIHGAALATAGVTMNLIRLRPVALDTHKLEALLGDEPGGQ